jgi:hypothetical protein
VSLAGPGAGQDLNARAVRVCERSYDAWFSCRGSDSFHIPLSVLAAFMLADGIDGPVMLKSPDAGVVQGIRETWTWFWMRRPDLCNMAGPLGDWVNDEDLEPGVMRAVARTARAAVKAGITGVLSDGHLLDVDLLGHAHMTLRPKVTRDARGEFYTPPAVCYAMAKMILGDCKDLEPGMSIAEPAAGTGGMLRAAAQVLRECGRDPAEFWWVINDISPLAVAGLAVNAHVWGLGHNVIIGVADTLANPDWYHLAWEYQQTAIARRDSLFKDAVRLALLRSIGRPGARAALDAAPIPGDPPAAADVQLPPDGGLFDLADITGGADPVPVKPAARRSRRAPRSAGPAGDQLPFGETV